MLKVVPISYKMNAFRKRPFHFHSLGFTRNPFGALNDDEWLSIAILTPRLQKALQTATHVQIIGPKGCGKSTALRWLTAHLQQENELSVVYEYLPEGSKRFNSKFDRLDVFLLDEAQRLNRRERRRWLKGVRNGRLRTIFSSHVNLTGLFERFKMQLTTINLESQISLEHYANILNKRLGAFALDSQPKIWFSDDAVLFLYNTFQLDLREMEYFLYEVWQGLEDVGEVTAVFLQSQYKQYQAQKITS